MFIFKLFVKFLVAFAFGAFVVVGAHLIVDGSKRVCDWSIEQWGSMVRAVTRVEIVKEYVHAEAVPLDKLIEKVSTEVGVHNVALRAIVEQESSGAKRLYRFEERKYAELKRNPQFAKLSDDEVRMLASSHGSAHVMGFNAGPLCQMAWSDLYDPYLGLKCGARILRSNMNRHNTVKDPSRRLWLAFRDYNGSGVDAENYADKIMSRVGQLLFANLGN